MWSFQLNWVNGFPIGTGRWDRRRPKQIETRRLERERWQRNLGNMIRKATDERESEHADRIHLVPTGKLSEFQRMKI